MSKSKIDGTLYRFSKLIFEDTNLFTLPLTSEVIYLGFQTKADPLLARQSNGPYTHFLGYTYTAS